MSYDFFLWAGPPAANAAEAFALIERVGNDGHRSLEDSPRVQAFLDEFFATYPSLEELDVGEDEEIDSPWAYTADISDRHALLSISRWTEQSHSALEEVIRLSVKHQLHCFDPQGGDFYDSTSIDEQPTTDVSKNKARSHRVIAPPQPKRNDRVIKFGCGAVMGFVLGLRCTDDRFIVPFVAATIGAIVVGFLGLRY